MRGREGHRGKGVAALQGCANARGGGHERRTRGMAHLLRLLAERAKATLLRRWRAEATRRRAEATRGRGGRLLHEAVCGLRRGGAEARPGMLNTGGGP